MLICIESFQKRVKYTALALLYVTGHFTGLVFFDTHFAKHQSCFLPWSSLSMLRLSVLALLVPLSPLWSKCYQGREILASLAECGTFHDCLFLETLQLLFLYQKTLMLPVPAGSDTFFWGEAQLKHPFFQETLPDTQRLGWVSLLWVLLSSVSSSGRRTYHSHWNDPFPSFLSQHVYSLGTNYGVLAHVSMSSKESFVLHN